MRTARHASKGTRPDGRPGAARCNDGTTCIMHVPAASTASIAIGAAGKGLTHVITELNNFTPLRAGSAHIDAMNFRRARVGMVRNATCWFAPWLLSICIVGFIVSHTRSNFTQ